VNKLIAEIKQLPLRVWAAGVILVTTVALLLIIMPKFVLAGVVLALAGLAVFVWAAVTIIIYFDGR